MCPLNFSSGLSNCVNLHKGKLGPYAYVPKPCALGFASHRGKYAVSGRVSGNLQSVLKTLSIFTFYDICHS